ncbi:hypothetical protein V7111_07200 [Neobacillus niacini]|uniref:hypothetical protein n=1 Tax=Neobacillus niacini TaxID=86668 RepID=UPI002FFEBF4D
MFYYLVTKIGDGTRDNHCRPDFDGSFVWNPDAICPTCGLYVVGLAEQTDLLEPVTDLESACQARGLLIDDVVKWSVGDG